MLVVESVSGEIMGLAGVVGQMYTEYVWRRAPPAKTVVSVGNGYDQLTHAVGFHRQYWQISLRRPLGHMSSGVESRTVAFAVK